MPVVFIAAVFLSAALLFSIQPIVAKLVLPRLGGSPAVWTTAMLFFQAILLAGYVYAHLIATRLTARTQAVVHGFVLIAGALFLPIALPEGWEYDSAAPITPQVLTLFALMVGAPFMALAANAPLLQSWYSATGRHDAHDPYFLYAASNVGSVIALIGYPLLLEPMVGGRMTSWLWAGGYAGFGVLLLACAASVPGGARVRTASTPTVRIPPLRWLRWIALAALPSSMMLSTTQVIATDIGSFPLLWVIPLALYLLSFVLAFSRRARPPVRLVEMGFLVCVIFLIVALSQQRLYGLGWWGFALLLLGFAFTALLFHMRLHDDRPPAEGLTGFYLAMSVGGVLGGIFNAALAPMLFDDLLEAPVVLALAGLVLVGAVRPGRDVLVAAVLLAATLGLVWLQQYLSLPSEVAVFVAAAFPVVFLLASRSRPIQFTVLAAGLLTAGYLADRGDVVQRSRSFFGIYTVHDAAENGVRRLSHGTTIHGQQFLDELGPDIDKLPESLAYYHPNGAMGQGVLMQAPEARIGIVGLGVGALACHAAAGQEWTFYEIDGEVDRIARDPSLFTFMSRCGSRMPTVLGDARLELERELDRRFDLLIIDAFSSDAIPIHLMTLEALQLYRDRLTPGGTLMFHVTNRFFDLPPVLGRAAGELGLTARIRERVAEGEAPLARGEANSVVVAMSADPELFAADSRWRPLDDDGEARWTDDHASLLSVLRR